jgi:hypothetical protein
MEFSGQIGRRGAAIVSQRGDKDKTKLCYARLPAQNPLQRFPNRSRTRHCGLDEDLHANIGAGSEIP